MSALWKWGTVNIYTSEMEMSREIRRAELFVLGQTSSVFQYFGAGSKHWTIRGLVIGSGIDTIFSDAANNTSRTFTTPYESVANAKIHGAPKATAMNYAGAVIDGVAYDPLVTPIYTVELEIIA